MREFLDSMAGHKTVVLDRIPTVENMAAVAFDILADVYDAHYGVNLQAASACVCTKRRTAGPTSNATEPQRVARRRTRRIIVTV